MSLNVIKNFLVYVLIGLVSKAIFENQISFFIATFISDQNSPKELIKNIILINIVMFIYRIIDLVYLKMGNF
jgi:lipid-A-disaccharide synthase-like uncharacterized protein